MISRKIFEWKYILLLAIACVFLWGLTISGDGSGDKSQPTVSYHSLSEAVQNATRTDFKTVQDEQRDTSIEIDTEVLNDDTVKAVITLIGNLSIIADVTNEIYYKIRKRFYPVIDATTKSVKTYDFDDSVLSEDTVLRLQEKLGCFNRRYEKKVLLKGDYWVYTNFVMADHGILECHQHVTYTTHSDFSFLDNLDNLLLRWESPVSVALHTPGHDLYPTIDSIRYLRDCGETADLVKEWVSFHIYFHKDHMPSKIPAIEEVLAETYNCSLPEPFFVDSSSRYTTNHSLLYPINVGRNIAREAALTHFIFPSDIELYPSPKLSQRFLNMIAREPLALNGTNPRVYPLVLFEVEHDQEIPMTKTQLQHLLKKKKAIPFHKNVCSACHNVPRGDEWMKLNETGRLDIFTIGKRLGAFKSWEPIYIGTNAEPMYEERLSWEGKSDKMTQGYVMCVKDYDYMILNEAFLVHRPGIKRYVADPKRDAVVWKTHQLIQNVIKKELFTIFGNKEGCYI